jgi:hypothetical protein
VFAPDSQRVDELRYGRGDLVGSFLVQKPHRTDSTYGGRPPPSRSQSGSYRQVHAAGNRAIREIRSL